VKNEVPKKKKRKEKTNKELILKKCYIATLKEIPEVVSYVL
jgi:hypothetical protein